MYASLKPTLYSRTVSLWYLPVHLSKTFTYLALHWHKNSVIKDAV